jgi:hypothetical protein
VIIILPKKSMILALRPKTKNETISLAHLNYNRRHNTQKIMCPKKLKKQFHPTSKTTNIRQVHLSLKIKQLIVIIILPKKSIILLHQKKIPEGLMNLVRLNLKEKLNTILLMCQNK